MAADEHFGLCVNLANIATTQYLGWGFNSFCRTPTGECLGASENGVFELGGDSDAGVDIDALIQFATTDFGGFGQKQHRAIYVGFEADGALKFSLRADEGSWESAIFRPEKENQRQNTAEITQVWDQKGRYWTYKIENLDGADFKINEIHSVLVDLGIKPLGF